MVAFRLGEGANLIGEDQRVREVRELKESLEPHDAERTAVERRLDVRLARLAAEATARSLELTRVTRFVNVLEAGYVNSSETGEPRRDGYEIELELPLFDFGATRAARESLPGRLSAHKRGRAPGGERPRSHV